MTSKPVSLAVPTRTPTSTIVRTDRRILIYDIERLPGTFATRHRGLHVEGSFWDLGAYKHVLGRRIRPDEVTVWPQMLCASARWYGDSKRRTMFTALWEDGGRSAMAETMWSWFQEADIVVGYNHVSFDNPHVRGLWIEENLDLPSSWKDVDLYRVIKRLAGYESKTLGAVTERLGIPTKDGRYDAVVAQRALDGSVVDQRRLKRYNVGDIDATTGLFDYLRKYTPYMPHVVALPGMGQVHCPNCGGGNLKKNGLAVKQVLVYQRYACRDCGNSNVLDNRHHRDSDRRGHTQTVA